MIKFFGKVRERITQIKKFAEMKKELDTMLTSKNAEKTWIAPDMVQLKHHNLASAKKLEK